MIWWTNRNSVLHLHLHCVVHIFSWINGWARAWFRETRFDGSSENIESNRSFNWTTLRCWSSGRCWSAISSCWRLRDAFITGMLTIFSWNWWNEIGLLWSWFENVLGGFQMFVGNFDWNVLLQDKRHFFSTIYTNAVNI